MAVELKRRAAIDEQIYYFRKVREYEVDFVRIKDTRVLELIQVTYDFSQPRTKLYNREIGNLVKASNILHCDNLTLIMMYGEQCDIVEDSKTIHCISATEWLLKAES